MKNKIDQNAINHIAIDNPYVIYSLSKYPFWSTSQAQCGEWVWDDAISRAIREAKAAGATKDVLKALRKLKSTKQSLQA